MLKRLSLVALLVFGFHAAADLELRGQFGTMPKQGGTLNDGMDNIISPNPSVNTVTTLGADLIFKIPVVPLAIGLRYESLNGSASGQGTVSSNPGSADAKISGSRLLALASYRLISTPIVYLGLIGHYALSKSLKYTDAVTVTSSGATTNYSFNGTVPASYGGGLEVGLTLGHFVLGLEGGYTSFKLTNMVESNGLITSSTNPTLDLSGMYLRASIGLSFF